MLYTEKEKHEIERVKEVFTEHLRQSPDFELLWSDKVGYVWLTIGVNPLYVDTGIRIESAADLCGRCLDDVATDVLYMTGNDHALEAADPLELAEIKRRWEPYINQLPDYAYLCKDLLNGKCNLSNEESGAIRCFWHLFCRFFVNLIKKSLTICLWQDSQKHFDFLRCKAGSL
ncbi:hypothetical protein [Agathobaculum massiliense]